MLLVGSLRRQPWQRLAPLPQTLAPWRPHTKSVISASFSPAAGCLAQCLRGRPPARPSPACRRPPACDTHACSRLAFAAQYLDVSRRPARHRGPCQRPDGPSALHSLDARRWNLGVCALPPSACCEHRMCLANKLLLHYRRCGTSRSMGGCLRGSNVDTRGSQSNCALAEATTSVIKPADALGFCRPTVTCVEQRSKKKKQRKLER